MRCPKRAFVTFVLLCLAACGPLLAQDTDQRGRKYTPPPPVAHITVTVTKGNANKPVESAAVILHTFHNGHDDGNLEVKTNEEGRAVIDVVPIGESVRLQVIKLGFQTYGEDFEVSGPTHEIAVKLHAPVHQVSSYDQPAQQAPSSAEPAQTPAPH
jgi:hypothetical protein